MKNQPRHPLSEAQREALEARFALRLSAHLEAGSQRLPHDITERLRVARAQSIAQAVANKAAAAKPVAQTQTAVGWQLAGASASGESVGTLSGWSHAIARATGHGRHLDDAPLGWGWRLASALPLIALVAGLWGVHTWYKHEQLQAATDVDMALLTDDLPPNAYSDPGFEEYLRAGDPDTPAASPEPAAPSTDSAPSTDHETT